MLQATNIHKSYGTKRNLQRVLRGIDVHVQQGEFMSIMGASGSGKTTLLNVLSTIDRANEGTILIDGKNVSAMKGRDIATFRKHHIGFIFQEYHLLDTLTVKENILLPLSVQNMPKDIAEEAFQSLAQELHITNIQHKYPYELSGGQKQRTSAARALIHQPSIVFADEPTGALDSKAASDVLHNMQQLHEKREATIVMVTHDPVAASYSSRVLFIKDGLLYAQLHKGDETREDFLKDIMKTQGVLSGVTYE